MRISRAAFGCAALLASASAAFAVNPPSEDAPGLVLRSTLGDFSGRSSVVTEPVADVKPGETFTITGDCVARVPSADDLRVVLTLAETPDGDATGYRAVLATDQRIMGGNLQVRVPELPEAENHVFQVKVFRLSERAPEMCEAGAIRIGAAEKVG